MTISQKTSENQAETVHNNNKFVSLSERDKAFDELVSTPKEKDELAPKTQHSKNKIPKNPKPTMEGRFHVDGTGVYHIQPTQGEELAKETYISSPIWPIAHLRNMEGKSHTILIKVHDGEIDHSLAVPRRLLAKWP